MTGNEFHFLAIPLNSLSYIVMELNNATFGQQNLSMTTLSRSPNPISQWKKHQGTQFHNRHQVSENPHLKVCMIIDKKSTNYHPMSQCINGTNRTNKTDKKTVSKTGNLILVASRYIYRESYREETCSIFFTKSSNHQTLFLQVK